MPDADAVANDVEKKKETVKLKKSVADRIRLVNAQSGLAKPLKLGLVAGPLAALDVQSALGILDALLEEEEEAAGKIKDPNSWVCKAARKHAARAAANEEEWVKWEKKEEQAAGDLVQALPTAVAERIRKVNR